MQEEDNKIVSSITVPDHLLITNKTKFISELMYWIKKGECPLCGKKWIGWNMTSISVSWKKEDREIYQNLNKSHELMKSLIADKLGVCPICYQS